MEATKIKVELDGVSALKTADDWADWLNNAVEVLPDVELTEESVAKAWYTNQAIEARFRAWVNEHPNDNISKAMIAFHSFRDSVFDSIAASKFVPDSVLGVSIMMAVFTISYRDEVIDSDDYQQCLEAATAALFSLVHKSQGSKQNLTKPHFPRTIHPV